MPKDMLRHEHDKAAKNQFIGAMLATQKLNESALLTGILYETARKIWRKYREHGSVENLPRSGRPKKIDKHTSCCLARVAVKNR